MRALLVARIALGAIALSGCALVTPVVDDLTGTTIDQRCPGYLLDLQLAQEGLTIAAPGSPEAEMWARRVALAQRLVDRYCASAPVPSASSAVDSGSPP